MLRRLPQILGSASRHNSKAGEAHRQTGVTIPQITIARQELQADMGDRRCGVVVALVAVLLAGCTSMGHEARAVPRIARPTERIVELGIDGDDNELAVAIERMLDDHGVKVTILSTPQVRETRADREYTYEEVQTRYVLRVRSTDLDKCVPEGSRQMHFNVSVTDFQERRRTFLMSGEFGCRDTLVRSFERWLLSGKP